MPNPITIPIPTSIINTSPQSSPVSRALPTPPIMKIKPDTHKSPINPSEVRMLKIHSHKDSITFPIIAY